jgi:hypothetical protein
MKTRQFNTVPERAEGWTHKFTIEPADLNDTAGLTKTLTLLSGLVAGDIVRDAAFYLETPFAGTGITNLALDVGYDVATGTDDPDGLLDNYELAGAATEVLAGDANGASFATLRTGQAFVESASVTALFTAVGANLALLTTGKVHVFLRVSRLAKLD